MSILSFATSPSQSQCLVHCSFPFWHDPLELIPLRSLHCVGVHCDFDPFWQAWMFTYVTQNWVVFGGRAVSSTMQFLVSLRSTNCVSICRLLRLGTFTTALHHEFLLVFVSVCCTFNTGFHSSAYVCLCCWHSNCSFEHACAIATSSVSTLCRLRLCRIGGRTSCCCFCAFL